MPVSSASPTDTSSDDSLPIPPRRFYAENSEYPRVVECGGYTVRAFTAGNFQDAEEFAVWINQQPRDLQDLYLKTYHQEKTRLKETCLFVPLE